jgi:hypothetical protein
MNEGKTVFQQLTDHLPSHEFARCVERYRGSYKVQSFTCWNQLLCMMFAQLTFRESLRDTVACLGAMAPKLYHMGIRAPIARTTLADANEARDWRIYADFAGALIRRARALYAGEGPGVDLSETAYALDSTTIDLCLSLFPWAHYTHARSAVKVHTLLDLRGNIPAFIRITDGKASDVGVLDHLVPEPGSIYVMDRGYLDFGRLYALELAKAFFVVRARSGLVLRRISSSPVDRATGLRSDQIVRPAGAYSGERYPAPLRRVRFYDAEHGRSLVFLSNHFSHPALTIAHLYRRRWQVELFFKWIKQHLRIRSFFGTSENALKTQIWTAVCAYALVAIVRQQLGLNNSMYQMLQVISVSAFEKQPIRELIGKEKADLWATCPRNPLLPLG